MTTPPVLARSRSGIARLGGVLTIGSALLLVVVAAFGFAGQPVGLGSIGVAASGGLVLLGVLVLAAVGLGLIAVASPPPLHGRLIRTGLLALAAGTAGLTASSLAAMTITYDPLEHGPSVIMLLAGLIGMGIGVPVTIVGFVRAGGRPRRLVLTFLAGLVLVIIGGNIAFSLFTRGAIHEDLRPLLAVGIGLALIGTAAMLGAFAGVGWLAARSDRVAEHPSA